MSTLNIPRLGQSLNIKNRKWGKHMKNEKKDRINYLVTMELCFDDPDLDFDENWIQKKLKNSGLKGDELYDCSIDAFREELKNHLVGGGSYVITKWENESYNNICKKHYDKLTEMYMRNNHI